MPLSGSANRDERKFPDPDHFNLRRAAAGYVGCRFGIYFLATRLVWLEGRDILEALLVRSPRLSLTELEVS
jgi:cytochrome P450